MTRRDYQPESSTPPHADREQSTAHGGQTDRYWNAIVGNGGKESDCGWCKDCWGHSWQITPKRLMDLMIGSDRDKAKRAMEAMMTIEKNRHCRAGSCGRLCLDGLTAAEIKCFLAYGATNRLSAPMAGGFGVR